MRDLSWWRHQMEAFSAQLTLCAGNSPVHGEFPAQSQWRGAFMLSLICLWINGWVNNREAGDLRRYRAHYDVTVMCILTITLEVACEPLCDSAVNSIMSQFVDRNAHYNDVIMSTIASQITSLTIVYSTVYSGVDQRKHQSSTSLAFVWGIHRGPVNSPHKGPVTLKMFSFDDVIMCD